tara:strand:+ start:1049 stop:1816 length:768 start_codon:yes stop_codon:yes gene_type:complete
VHWSLNLPKPKPVNPMKKRRPVTIELHNKLQTNKPKGTFKRGDPHPTMKGYVFINFCKKDLGCNKHPEYWNTEEYYHKYKIDAKLRERRRRKAQIDNKIKTANTKRIPQRLIQTNKPKGSFKKGDPHPEYNNLFYIKWRNDTSNHEQWRFNKSLKVARKQILRDNALRRIRMKGARVNLSNTEKDILAGIYDLCRRINKCLQLETYFGNVGVFSVDHIIPLDKGGEHHPSNLQIVPHIWNMQKNKHGSQRWEPYR